MAERSEQAMRGRGGGAGGRSPLLPRVLPWAISLAVHAALVVVAVFVVWSSLVSYDYEPVIPVVELGHEPGQPLEAELDAEMQLPADARQRETRSLRDLASPRPLEDRAASLESVPMLEGIERPLPLEGGAEASAAYETEFFGVGGNARHVAFVVDASGSLTDTMPYVLRELQSTIGRLNSQQSFTVVFFQGDELIEPLGEGMKAADVYTRQQMQDWIDPSAGRIEPGGRSHPLIALEHVMNLDPPPRLIFLLSDNITGTGRYSIGAEELVSRIAAMNEHEAAINTLQFIYRDPRTRQGRAGTMRMIAEQTGGQYRFVSGEDLGLR